MRAGMRGVVGITNEYVPGLKGSPPSADRETSVGVAGGGRVTTWNVVVTTTCPSAGCTPVRTARRSNVN